MSNNGKTAIVLRPSKTPMVAYDAYGFYTLSEVLHIPSSQLIWVDNNSTTTLEEELAKRFPCDDPGFSRFQTGSSSKSPEGLSQSTIHASIFTSKAFSRNERYATNESKAIMDDLYKEAKKRPIVLISYPHYGNRLRKGFVIESGAGWRVLRFDQNRWAEEEARRVKRVVDSAVMPRGFITVPELRWLAESMQATLENLLAEDKVEHSWFRVEIKYTWRSKRQCCESVINLYDLGVRLFGAKFWSKESSEAKSMTHWDVKQRKYVRHHAVKPVAKRWKKEKLKPPKSDMAKRIWKIVLDVAKAPLRRGPRKKKATKKPAKKKVARRR